MKTFPGGSHVISVGRLNRYGCAGGGGVPGAGVASTPSTASGRLPMVISTRPSGLNLTTMLVPSSTAQMLSCESTRTPCAISKPYKPWPISRTRSEQHTSELQSRFDLVCRLLLEKKKKKNINNI